MATTPTVNDTIRAILDAAATYGPRPGEIVPTLGVQMKLGTGYTAAELTAAFEEMLARGWIEPKVERFFKLTQLGFDEM
jgi:hypothetical protein